ncbi:MoaD/ThiS family protein [Fulvivirga sp. 29W222]|uniref:Molybdopterin synthase sulfur carrier subunit n=1 Tax=Fulvivirga marina TaxID=2494733 RepID=A0A937KCJ3_9BACT|nr:MoaD/ThiS family protein [Fulvivirga marina]MBL6445293.1 MoaD/ThiS family protein [Fulvivirga marina]
MEVEILAFGITRDIVGGSTFKIFLEREATVSALKELLYQKYPKMKQLRSLMIAVDNEYVDEGLELKGQEEIALIPPVSGG